VNKKIRVTDLPEFDITDYLEDERAIAEYLTVVLQENDPAALVQALSTVARVRGMNNIASVSHAALQAFHQAS
jgi:probable addiction module antidote protein